MYLFTGDYVDYGENGIEILMTILAFKLLYPESVFHLRGCHESLKYNHMFVFLYFIYIYYDRVLVMK